MQEANLKTSSKAASLFWGRVAPLSRRIRIVALVFTMATIVSLSFCQLGFWPIGEVAGRAVYIMLILAPPIVGALLFGPVTGALLGLFAGAVAFAHADSMPLDFYEYNVMTPLNTFGMLTFVGLLAGLLFKFGLRHDPRGGKRVGIIIGICIALSVVASGFIRLNMTIQYGGERLSAIQEYLLMTPVGMLAQMVVDAAAIAVLCLVVDAIFLSLSTRSPSERKLLTVFCGWMLTISVIVFMLTSAIIFTVITIQESDEADKSMLLEARYLAGQMDVHPDSNPATLLVGYTVEDDGNVVITDKLYTILGTDNEERFPVGDSFVDDIGYGTAFSNPEDPSNNLLQIIVDGNEASKIQTYTTDGTWTMEFSYITAAAYDEGYVAVLRNSDMVFQSRFSTLASTTLLAFLLIFATALVASWLLRSDIARRIDETNESLVKITEGNLDEAGCPPKAANHVMIAVEELVVNVCSYAYPDATPGDPGLLHMHITLQTQPNAAVVEISDNGVAFNPLERDDPERPESIEDAKVGGLGLLMTKKLMDKVEYVREGLTNTTTITKCW